MDKNVSEKDKARSLHCPPKCPVNNKFYFQMFNHFSKYEKLPMSVFNMKSKLFYFVKEPDHEDIPLHAIGWSQG